MGIWDRLKHVHGHSLTVAYGHLLIWVGVAMEALDMFPDVAQSLGLQQIIPPQFLGVYTITLAALTILARVRSLHRKVDDHA